MNQATCVECGAVFDSEAMLDAHRKEANHPAIKKSEKHECSVCGFLMESEAELQRHLLKAHTSPSRRQTGRSTETPR